MSIPRRDALFVNETACGGSRERTEDPALIVFRPEMKITSGVDSLVAWS